MFYTLCRKTSELRWGKAHHDASLSVGQFISLLLVIHELIKEVNITQVSQQNLEH